MDKEMKLMVLVWAVTMLVSCSKNEISENCYVCSTEEESIDVCEEDGNFLIDGEVVENPNGASLEDLIRAVEANPDNGPALEGIMCSRK